MSYVDTIRSIMPLSFDNIIKTAKQHVPDAYQHAPWTYPGLNHGTAIVVISQPMERCTKVN